MIAKTKQEYEEAWTHHIRELANLALAANIDYAEYSRVRDELTTWLETAKQRYPKE